jgi:hypothetical protein
MQNNDNLSEEDYLKKHLSDIDSANGADNREIKNDTKTTQKNTEKVIGDMQFFNFSIDSLPCGKFYPVGTQLMIRPAKVKEIQAYSMVDDNNFYDVVNKMNLMLQYCVRLKYPNGSMGSFIDIKDQDRLYIVFLIRELTFQKGNELTVTTKCPMDNTDVVIELKKENFILKKEDDRLEKFFDVSRRCYEFKLKNGKKYYFSPPNIGIQKSFADFVARENAEKKETNLSFLKIIPFMLGDRNSISYEEIKKMLEQFEEIDDISFQFLNAAASKMVFGIEELRKKCECGQEVRTDMQFPDGPSRIFVVRDAFDAYIEE